MNFDKSKMCFENEVDSDVREELAGVCITECHDKYLEIPKFAKRSKELFSFIKDRIWNKDGICF